MAIGGSNRQRNLEYLRKMKQEAREALLQRLGKVDLDEVDLVKEDRIDLSNREQMKRVAQQMFDHPSSQPHNDHASGNQNGYAKMAASSVTDQGDNSSFSDNAKAFGEVFGDIYDQYRKDRRHSSPPRSASRDEQVEWAERHLQRRQQEDIANGGDGSYSSTAKKKRENAEKARRLPEAILPGPGPKIMGPTLRWGEREIKKGKGGQ